MAGKITRLVYKRKATFKKVKKITLIMELAPQRLDFGGEPVMAQNDDNLPLREFTAPKANDIQLGYTVSTVGANNFELKPALLNMLSQHMFHGLAHEDSNQHLAMFEDLCNNVKINGIEHEAIKLRAFPFSLGDRVRSWLRSLDAGTIVT
jgi:hypothetical protein